MRLATLPVDPRLCTWYQSNTAVESFSGPLFEMNVQQLTNTHFTVKVGYTYKAFFPSAFQGTSLNANPFSFYSEKHIIEGAFTIPHYSSSLLFSEDTQPFTETLAGPPPLGPLPPVSVLWKSHCSLGVLDAGTVPIRTNTVCRTNIFVLLNLIMHGVAK